MGSVFIVESLFGYMASDQYIILLAHDVNVWCLVAADKSAASPFSKNVWVEFSITRFRAISRVRPSDYDSPVTGLYI